MKPSIVAYALLLSGVFALVASIPSESSILAFIGLGLTFWGALLLFIKPTRYVRGSLLDATALNTLRTLDQMITDLDYKGKAVYLPPGHLRNSNDARIFIASKKNLSIPPATETATGEVFLKSPQGLCLIPPGLDLANLYEDELGKDLTKVNLSYLKDNLPKLFIEDLEIAENLEITVKDQMVHVKMAGPAHSDICREAQKLPNIHNSIGCPICSSIAIALTRSAKRPVVVDRTETSKAGKTIEAHYQLLEPIEAEAQAEALVEQALRLYRKHLLWNLGTLVLMILGLVMLAWVGYLIWYDIALWAKDIALILFQSRMTEGYSLGIDLRVIHYLIIGVAFLLSGLLTFLRTRRSKV